MINTVLFTTATFVFFGTFVLFLLYLVFRNDRLGQIAYAGTLLGWVVETAGLVTRTVLFSREMREHMPEKAGSLLTSLYYYFPVSNLYESLVFFAWTTIAIYLWIDYRYKVRGMGAPVSLVAAITMAYASLSANTGTQVEPLIPALQSNWLTIHVITSFLAYASFAVSFGASIYYLVAARGGVPAPQEAPAAGPRLARNGGVARTLDVADNIIYKTVIVGFFLLALGIVTGAAWANYAWGSYWSWDPKETWSLITWFVYASFLHSRVALGWQGRRSALFSMVGFAVTIFCYLGVNLVLSGMHSYGAPD